MREEVNPPAVSSLMFARRKRLAEDVCAELRMAGLPAHREDDVELHCYGGALVVAHPSAELDVSVEWRQSDQMIRASIGLTEDFDGEELFEAAVRVAQEASSGQAPALLRHTGVVSNQMTDAMIAILNSAGLSARRVTHGLCPYLIGVELL
ncbi:hypothetical protein [Nocardia sp. NPDC051832]|uniref:hypothetical protein n=1 Tax=Nocardia sp. NPDC051832 TaxID=3155673 RepID=UPI003412501E